MLVKTRLWQTESGYTVQFWYTGGFRQCERVNRDRVYRLIDRLVGCGFKIRYDNPRHIEYIRDAIL